jgi:O-antigen/teichoic acid export membrane protein
MQRFFSGQKMGALTSAAGVFISALFWLVGFKVVALWMGPEGIGLFSQLRQMAQAATIGATFGGTNSVVQGLAERQDELARIQFRTTASRVVGISSMVVVSTMIAAAPALSNYFLSSMLPDLVDTVRWLALAVLLNVGATYALAVLNGYRAYPYLAVAQIAGPLALVLALFCVRWWGVQPSPQYLAGAFVICFGVSCLIGAWGMSQLPKLTTLTTSGSLSTGERRAFIRFALSNLFAALTATISLLVIRAWMIDMKGLAFAGLFDAGWTLTFNYTTLFLTACSVMYLPLLAGAQNLTSQRGYMLRTAYLVLGFSLPICYVMVLLKAQLLYVLYSPEFEASGQVLMVLVIAVIFRGVSWVYGTLILATRRSRVLLISDAALNLCLLATTRYALQNFDSLEALSWAFVLPNFLYLVFVVEYARHKNSLMGRRFIWPLILVGIVPLFYVALESAVFAGQYGLLAQGFFMLCGLAVSAAAFAAYKKVVL